MANNLTCVVWYLRTPIYTRISLLTFDISLKYIHLKMLKDLCKAHVDYKVIKNYIYGELELKCKSE